MEEKDVTFSSPFSAVLRIVYRVLSILLFVLIIVNILPFALTLYPAIFPVDNAEQGQALIGLIKSASNTRDIANTGVVSILAQGWDVAKPALELLLIFGVLIWAWQSSFRGRITGLNLQWDSRTLIGVVLIVTFCVATLLSASAAGLLKDVVLVVVGFYFGSRESESKQETDTKVTKKQNPDDE